MAIKLAVIGAGGRMGRRTLSLAIESGQFDIVVTIERPGHPDIGKDAGLLAGSGPMGVVLVEAYPATVSDVVVDFSLADGLFGKVSVKECERSC